MHYKKNGTLDMRYKSSRDYVNSGGSINGPLADNNLLHYKNDGTLDMRFSINKQYLNSGGNIYGPNSTSSSTNYHSGSIGQSYGSNYQESNDYYGSNYNGTNYYKNYSSYNNNNYNNYYNNNYSNFNYSNNNYNTFSGMNFEPQPDPFASVKPYDINDNNFTERNHQIPQQEYNNNDYNENKNHKNKKKKDRNQADLDNLYPQVHVIERQYQKVEEPTSRPNIPTKKYELNYNYDFTNDIKTNTVSYQHINFSKRSTKTDKEKEEKEKENNRNVNQTKNIKKNISSKRPKNNKKNNKLSSIEVFIIIELICVFFYFLLLSYIPLPEEKAYFSKCPKNAICDTKHESNKTTYIIKKCELNYLKIENGLIQICSPNYQPKLEEYVQTLKAASFISKNDGKLNFRQQKIDSQKVLELFPNSNPSLFETDEDFMVIVTSNELKSKVPMYSAICRAYNNSVNLMPVQTLFVIIVTLMLWIYYFFFGQK